MAKRTADANRMRLFLRERFAPLLVLFGLGAVLPATLLAVWGDKMIMLGTQWHFTGVGVTALVAALAALALTVVGIRRNDGRVILLGTAFTVMAGLLAIHGLATPGVIVGYNGVISLTGAATLPAGGAVLALSALPTLCAARTASPHSSAPGRRARRRHRARRRRHGCSLLVPDVPEPEAPAADRRLIVGMVLFGILILRALKTYLLTRRSVDLAVVIGVAWLTAALPPAPLLTRWNSAGGSATRFELPGS